MNKIIRNEICMCDSLKVLKKEGFINLCQKYGTIKNVILYKNIHENQALIEFEDEASVYEIINEKSDFPSFIKIEISHRMQKSSTSSLYEENSENIEECDVNSLVNSLGTLDNKHIETENTNGQSFYFGSIVSESILIEESKQVKFNDKIKDYNLENDYLFGRPLDTKWEKPEYKLNNLDFYNRFENCTGGEIKIEKQLSPNMFTGWTTFFSGGENVQDKLKNISNDIENSGILNINNLKCGMLVGAFDTTTNLYGRGYVTLIAGNSVNIAMIDYGRVVNTVEIRVLPLKYTQLPAYSLKVYTKDNYVLQLKEKPYVFKVRSVCAERIVLIIFDESNEIKVQLKKWLPTIEETGVPYIDFTSGSKVELLKVKDMYSLYVRSKEKRHLDLFFSIWNTVAVYCYKNPQPLKREPLYGEIVGFKSTLTNNYVRARIHKYLGDNIYSVKHMDNPLKEKIKSSEMIELQFEQKSMPVTFLKVELSNALQYPIQFHAKHFIEYVINVCFTVYFDGSKKEGWKYVDLNITALKENMNAILFGLAEPSWLKDTKVDLTGSTLNFASYNNLLSFELEEKSVVNMTFVTYYEGIFYMRDKLFGKSYSLLSRMIKEYCSLNLNPYLPHNEEVCLGQFQDGIWYRVLCGHLKPGELAKVYSLDLGTVAFLTSKHMKRLPEELLFHPIHVYLCAIDTSCKINSEKLELLKKYENTDCEFTILKKDTGTNHYLIKCPFLEDILK